MKNRKWRTAVANSRGERHILLSKFYRIRRYFGGGKIVIYITRRYAWKVESDSDTCCVGSTTWSVKYLRLIKGKNISRVNIFSRKDFFKARCVWWLELFWYSQDFWMSNLLIGMQTIDGMKRSKRYVSFAWIFICIIVYRNKRYKYDQSENTIETKFEII